MKNPENEVKKLKEEPIKAEEGSIAVITAFERPSIALCLNKFPGRPYGSLVTLYPEEWVRVVEVMREYFKTEELWKKLAKFLNEIANEREQDSDGPGSAPTANSNSARKLMEELGIKRQKPSWLV